MIENVERCGGTPVVVEDRWGEPVDPQKVEDALKANPGHQDRRFRARRDLDRLAVGCQDAGRDRPQARRTNHRGRRHLARRHAGADRRMGHRRRLLRQPEVPVLHARAVAGERSATARWSGSGHARPRSTAGSWISTCCSGYWGNTNRTYHHTAPTNSLYALHESLLMLREEGLENAWARHQRNHKALKAGLESMGIKYLVEEPYRLPQMNAVYVPASTRRKYAGACCWTTTWKSAPGLATWPARSGASASWAIPARWRT